MTLFGRLTIIENEILIQAAFGNEMKTARITLHWIDTYYLFVDDYLEGIITLRAGLWKMHCNDDSYNLGDVLEIASLINANKKA